MTTPRRSSTATSAAVAAIALATIMILSVLTPTVSTADELRDKQAEAAQIADQLDALQMRLMELSGEFETAKAHLAEAEEGAAAAQEQSDSANSELQRISAELRTFSVGAYVTGGDDPIIDVIIKSSGDVAPQKQGYIQITSGTRKDMLDRYKTIKTKADADGERLASAQAEVQARLASLQQSQGEAKKAVERQSEIKAKIDGELGELVAQEQQRRAEQAARVAEEQAVRATAQAGVGTNTAGSTTPSATGPTTPGTNTSGTNTPAPNTPGPATPPPTTPSPSNPPPTTPPPVTPQPPTTPPPTTPPPPPATTGVRPTAQAAVNAGMSKIGSPYLWAGAGPNVFDCSGFTMWAWAQAGVSLPHYSGAQYTKSRRITIAEAQPGDLIFFWAPGAGGDPSHVGLYIGGNKMVHSPSAGNYVRVDSIYWWTGARIAAGRV